MLAPTETGPLQCELEKPKHPPPTPPAPFFLSHSRNSLMFLWNISTQTGCEVRGHRGSHKSEGGTNAAKLNLSHKNSWNTRVNVKNMPASDWSLAEDGNVG